MSLSSNSKALLFTKTVSDDDIFQCSKIYAIRSCSSPKYYIGSTTLNLKNRFNIHKYQYKQFLLGKFNYITVFEVLANHDCYIELIECHSCNNKKELHQREGQHIRSHLKLPICHLVNKKIDGRTPIQYLHDNLEKIKLYQKEYRRDNDVYYKQYMQRWLSEHPDYQKNYRMKSKALIGSV